jgi:diguanylate cyclase (GGDEF)-like protein
MVSALRNVDLQTYHGLLRRLIPSGCKSAITDVGAKVCSQDDAFPTEIFGPALAYVRREAGEGDSSSRMVRLRLTGAIVLIAPIGLPESEPQGYLWVRGEDDLDWDDIAHSLRSVVSCLVNDLTLNVELDSMASELTERYEELNLVYHTQDEVNYFAEGQQALTQLVANCCEYLNVGMAALIMPNKGIAISHMTDADTASDTQPLLDRLGGPLYDRVTEDKEPLVINDLASAEAAELWYGLAYKLLAAPVMDSKGGVSGVLAIANRNARPKFANSDKNLLKVMARKAAKIVQVNYDQLTGLVNREGFEFFADKRLQETRDQGIAHAVLHFNVDNLHVINDTINHDAGDALLCALATQLRGAVRDTDVVARLGGDEFALLLRQCPLKRAQSIAEKLRESIVDLLIPWTDRSMSTTVSIGVAPIDENTLDSNAAMTAAELACSAAKELGKNRVQIYVHGDTALVQRHHEMEAVGRIQTALHEDRFELFGQLIAPLVKQDRGIHVEVLLRMRNESGEILTPDKFLPAAERYHMMAEIDRHVFSKTLAYLDENWEILEPQLVMIALNLSGQTFGERYFAEFLHEQLSKISVPPERICLEITETAAMNNLDETRDLIAQFKQRGCKFALDDFGSGLSSFGYLRTLPVDILKIDGSLVKEVVDDEVSLSMVTAIQHIAKVMGLQTIAEYVESEAAKDKLREIGVSYAQGYGVSRPMPLAAHFSNPALRIQAAGE